MRRTGVEDLIRRRRGGEDGDTTLTDLLAKLADCPKARSASIHDRCKATRHCGCSELLHSTKIDVALYGMCQANRRN